MNKITMAINLFLAMAYTALMFNKGFNFTDATVVLLSCELFFLEITGRIKESKNV